uniref:Adaptin ear-binding coat-associated protein 1 n=1 Tax=Ailuropoda melanoleuca TaxID=9646 RepID=A0A7N5JJD2_AILME
MVKKWFLSEKNSPGFKTVLLSKHCRYLPAARWRFPQSPFGNGDFHNAGHALERPFCHYPRWRTAQLHGFQVSIWLPQPVSLEVNLRNQTKIARKKRKRKLCSTQLPTPARSRPSLRPAPGGAERRAKMAAELEYESVLCVKPDVSVYRIPPRASNRGYRASDWKLDQPDWTGRLRITSKGKIAYIKLEDKVSGELFAQAPVEQYPGIAVETVTDSSRYFVIRIQDGTGRSAFIGIGFTDRGDAFDFNVSLQDHFKWVKQESEISKESQDMDNRPKLDLGFKEGQTIKLSIGNITTKKGGASKPKTTGTGGLSLLPPPPGGKVTIPPPSSVAISNHVTPPPIPKSNHGGSDADILLDLDSPAPVTTPAPAPVSASNDLWGDFSTASRPPLTSQNYKQHK